MSSVSPVGTLAYIIDEEALLVRVNNGWQYIAVCCATFSFFKLWEMCWYICVNHLDPVDLAYQRTDKEIMDILKYCTPRPCRMPVFNALFLLYGNIIVYWWLFYWYPLF